MEKADWHMKPPYIESRPQKSLLPILIAVDLQELRQRSPTPSSSAEDAKDWTWYFPHAKQRFWRMPSRGYGATALPQIIIYFFEKTRTSQLNSTWILKGSSRDFSTASQGKGRQARSFHAQKPQESSAAHSPFQNCHQIKIWISKNLSHTVSKYLSVLQKREIKMLEISVTPNSFKQSLKRAAFEEVEISVGPNVIVATFQF